MKIVVLDGYTENPGDLSWSGLEALGEVTVYDRTSYVDAPIIAERIGDAEIVYTNKTPLTKETFDACPSVRYVGVLATGYNVVDIQEAQKRGIVVTNVPAYSTPTVAQFTMALLLEICHRAGHHSDAVHAGRWTASKDFCFWDYPLMELAGKTLGIIGFGRIGQAFGRIGKAFGMQVLAAGSRPTDAGRAIAEYVELDELYARADVISLHCPLFPENERMINRSSIAKMKDGVIILNFARDLLVDDDAMAEALASGKVDAIFWVCATTCKDHPEVRVTEPIDNTKITEPYIVLDAAMVYKK